MTDTCISGDKTRKFETDYYNNDSALLAKNINTKQNYNKNQQDNLNFCQSTIDPETPYYEAASPINSNENNTINNSNSQTEIFS